jgi:hypothetical protein
MRLFGSLAKLKRRRSDLSWIDESSIGGIADAVPTFFVLVSDRGSDFSSR